VVSQVHDSGSSQVHDLRASQVQDSRSSQVRDSELHRSRASDLRKFAILELHRFKIPDLHRFKIPENSFHEFRKTRRFEGDRLPEFPNTSPSGKRVDSDDPIPRKSQNFSKKRHAQNVGGDTRPPETSQRSNRGVFVELPPSPL
jgi:hypothetical protein